MKLLILLATTVLVTACAPTGPGSGPASSRSTGGALTASHPSSEVRDAQQRLQWLGLYEGQIDGMWGPESQVAVERFQRNRSLPTTAVLDSRTVTMLQAETPPTRAPALTRPIKLTDATDVRALQDRLRQLRFYTSAVDGIWGPHTQIALERFQKSHGLPVGQVTGQTISAMGLDAEAFPTRTALGSSAPRR